jgi:NAD(P)-dependent dehydrogenase (short-subunit alcohol dehydrogenase family)
MDNRLEGRIALITGSTSGIGRAIALRFAENGARVVVTGRRESWGLEVVARIRESDGRAEFYRADLASDEDGRRLVDFTVQTFGGLDILVNNAGMVPRNPDGSMRDGPIHSTDEAYWEDIWRVDLRSIFELSKLAVPHLLKSKHASIINVSSVHGVSGHGMDIYSAIKGAVISLTRSMAVSYAHRIRVNCISPGMVVVERTTGIWEEFPEVREQVQADYLTRAGKPDDIAYCAIYLASDEGEYVSGANFMLDGGLTIHGAFPPGPTSSRARLQVGAEE